MLLLDSSIARANPNEGTLSSQDLERAFKNAKL